jgi:hypothetical protein
MLWKLGAMAYCSLLVVSILVADELPISSGTAIAGVPNQAGGVSLTGTGFPPAVAIFEDGLESAVADASGAVGPTASTSASGDAEAIAYLTYYMTVAGANGEVVPVTISGLVGAGLGPDATGEANAYSDVTVEDTTANDEQLLFLYDCVGYGCGAVGAIATNGDYTLPLPVLGGDIIAIEVAAAANPIGTNGEAVADPYFQIDPSFLAANPGVSLEFSPGIENVPLTATPEPNAFCIMGAAMMGVVVVYRRRITVKR